MAAYDPYDEEGDYYYTLPSSEGDRFAAGSGSAVAFDEPTANGIRFPIATPQAGSFDFGAVPPGLIRTPEQSAAAYASRDQYNAELARAERNRFDEQMQQDPQAVQQAVRMKGLLKYQQLVRDGANPAEAIRLAAPELYYNHPQATVQATRMATPVTPSAVTTVPVPGGNAILFNNKLHSVLRTPAPPREVKPTLPPDAIILRNQATGDRKRIESEITKISADPRIDEAEKKDALQSLDQQLKAAKANELFHSTNRLSTPNIVKQAIPSAESRTLTKEIAADLLKQAKGDKTLARKLARDAGYDF